MRQKVKAEGGERELGIEKEEGDLPACQSFSDSPLISGDLPRGGSASTAAFASSSPTDDLELSDSRIFLCSRWCCLHWIVRVLKEVAARVKKKRMGGGNDPTPAHGV